MLCDKQGEWARPSSGECNQQRCACQRNALHPPPPHANPTRCGTSLTQFAHNPFRQCAPTKDATPFCCTRVQNTRAASLSAVETGPALPCQSPKSQSTGYPNSLSLSHYICALTLHMPKNWSRLSYLHKCSVRFEQQ